MRCLLRTTGSPQDLLTRTCARSCKDTARIHQDLFKSVSRGPVQDHTKAPDSISARSPQDLRTRRVVKNLEQDLHARTPKSVIKGPAAAGVDLTDLDTRTSQEPLPQAPLWHLQAWHFRLWWRAWVWRAPRLFAWQAWRLVTRGTVVTSTFSLRGGGGTWLNSLCMAGVALGDMDLHFAWQAWRLGWLWWRA